MTYFTMGLLLAMAVLSFAQGIGRIRHPEVHAKRQAKRKKKPDPDAAAVSAKRAEGWVSLVVGLLLLFSLRLAFGIHTGANEMTILQVKGDADRFNSLQKTVSTYQQQHPMPGLVVGIVQQDSAILLASGSINPTRIGKTEKVTEDTLFEIGSLSKVLTGLMISEAVDRGVMDLSDPLSNYLPVSGSEGGAIRLEQLVTHTSGLPRLPRDLRLGLQVYITGITAGNPYAGLSQERMLRALEREDFDSQEAASWAYSNDGFGLLGMVVGAVDGRGYDAQLQEVLAKPLSLPSLCVSVSEGNRLAKGYRAYLRLGALHLGGKASYWDMDSGMSGAGGVRASGKDMLQLLEACVANTPTYLSNARLPLYRINETRQMGMAWILDDEVLNGQTVAWHNGQTGGFNSYMALIEGRSTGVVLLASTAASDVQPLGESLLAQLSETLTPVE